MASPVFGPANMLPKLKQQKVTAAIIAIGDNTIRRTYAARVREHGFELINAIHPARSGFTHSKNRHERRHRRQRSDLC